MRALIAAGCTLALASLSMPPATADETGDRLRAVVEQVAPAIVTLRVVVSVSFGGGGAREQRGELQGTLLSPEGLILLQEGPFGTNRGRGFEMKVSVNDLKIVIGNEEKEYDGFLVANDSKLHLAFVQMEGLEGRALPCVNLEDAASPEVGDPIVTVTRQGKGFDYAPYFQSGRISGRVKKPRQAWDYEGGASPGLPCFALDGKVIGVPSPVESGVEEHGFARGGTFILPARTVRASVQQAQKKAAELLKTRAEEKAKAAAAGEKPTESPKDDAPKDEGDQGEGDQGGDDDGKKEGGE